MVMDTRIRDLITEIGTTFNTRVGDPSTLVTVANDAVAAINELKGLIDALSGGSLSLDGLDDVTITGGALNDILARNAGGQYANIDGTTLFDPAGAADAVKDEILGGATSAFDTLMELKALMDAADADDQADIVALTAVVGTKQAAHAILTNLAGLALSAGDIIRATGANTFATTASGAMGLTLLGAADAAAARTSLSVWSQTEVGPIDTNYVTLLQAALV